MEKILSFIEEKKYGAIKEYLAEINVVDIADIFENIPIIETIKIFRLMTKDKAAEVFTFLSSEKKEEIVNALTDKELCKIVDELFIDDAVDFVEEMPANVVRRILQSVKPETRDEINQLLKYPHASVGSIMTTEFVDLKEMYTVEKAFSYIKKVAVQKETIYTCYVMDEDRTLVGVVMVKDLLLSDSQTLIKDIMNTNVIYSHTNEDQEELARQFKKYGLLAVPVVDNEERLVGIVTIDDIVDVIQEETTEDIHKMAAMNPLTEPYLKTGVISLAKKRILWLTFLLISGMITGLIINAFESSLAILPILASFIPMLMGTGGNAGTQVSTLIIRDIALNEIIPKDLIQILWKELRVSLLVGTILAIITFIRVIIFNHNLELAFVVSFALLFIVIIAKIVGACLPILAKVIKVDPALMASPFITTIVDISSLAIFFIVATMILPEI